MQHSLQNGADNAPTALSAQENGAEGGRSPSSAHTLILNRIGPLQLFKKAVPGSLLKSLTWISYDPLTSKAVTLVNENVTLGQD